MPSTFTLAQLSESDWEPSLSTWMTEVVGADGCWAAMVCIADVAAVAGS